MSETNGARLRAWLLLALEDLGGRGPRQSVHNRVERLFGSQFSREDRSPRIVKGVRREPAWQNNLDSLYDRMKKSGHLETVARGGPWTLAEAGQREVLALMPASAERPAATDEGALLANFKPGNSTAYLAHLRGRTLLKTRAHEDVLGAYGRGITRRGWTPTTAVHPRDLELQRGVHEICLVEVKMIYEGNAARAVREAVAQLLEYRHFHYSSERAPILLAVFSESVGTAFVDYLETLGIASAWRVAAGGWDGGETANFADLVP